MNINSTIVLKPPVATEKDLRRCKAIESLLVQPLGVLPTEIGDPIRPVTIGFFQQVSPFLKPDASVSALRRAIGAYVHSKRYYLSCSKTDAMRHDLTGIPSSQFQRQTGLMLKSDYPHPDNKRKWIRPHR